MKNILIWLALAAATQANAAPAEVWLVKATFNYVKADGSIVADQPALSFRLSPGECRKGVTRVTQMPHADMTMTQKACLKVNGQTGLVTASGWLMSPQVVTDVLQIDGTRSNALALDYGQQFDIETNGTMVHSRIGPYNVEVRRIGPDGGGQSKKVAGDKKAVGKKG